MKPEPGSIVVITLPPRYWEHISARDVGKRMQRDFMDAFGVKLVLLPDEGMQVITEDRLSEIGLMRIPKEDDVS